LIPIGLADIKKPGTDVTMFLLVKLWKVAMAAAKELEAEAFMPK